SGPYGPGAALARSRRVPRAGGLAARHRAGAEPVARGMGPGPDSPRRGSPQKTGLTDSRAGLAPGRRGRVDLSHTGARTAAMGRRLRVAGGYALFALAVGAATSVTLPELGAPLVETVFRLVQLAGFSSLVAASLALVASGRSPALSAAWMTSAILATSIAIAAMLATVSVSPVFVSLSVLVSFVALEIWSRAVAVLRRAERVTTPRLLGGSVLLTLLI